MSDLQCPATVIVVRHGEAEFDIDSWPDAGGSLTRLGREQARRLGESLLDRRVAAVWCSDISRAVQTAEIAAAVLGVGVGVRPALREYGVGRPDETADDLVARFSLELQSLADLVRGETALVVAHGAAIALTVPRIAGNVPDDFSTGRPFDNCAGCELTADSRGWVLHTWQGAPVGVSNDPPIAGA